MNYTPFGPSTRDTDYADGKHYAGSMSLDVADRLVARGHAKNAKESKIRFSTLIKTLQREAMPNMTYPAHGAKWVETKRHDEPHLFTKLTWFSCNDVRITTRLGRTYLEEVSTHKDHPLMTEAILLADWWKVQLGGQA